MRIRQVAAFLGISLVMQGTAFAGSPVENISTSKPRKQISAVVGDDTSQSATGYLFVNGVGYKGAHMVYCNPTVGFVAPGRVLSGRKAALIINDDGQCVEGEQNYGAALTAQQYLDVVMDGHLAKVVSVGPVLAQGYHLGIIYYREIARE